MAIFVLVHGARGGAHGFRREIATGHMIPSNRPEDLARLLLELT